MSENGTARTRECDRGDCSECEGYIQTPTGAANANCVCSCHRSEKTPTHECVYCEESGITFIGKHHREEHPSGRYDPRWYMDDVEADEGPIA